MLLREVTGDSQSMIAYPFFDVVVVVGEGTSIGHWGYSAIRIRGQISLVCLRTPSVLFPLSFLDLVFLRVACRNEQI